MIWSNQLKELKRVTDKYKLIKFYEKNSKFDLVGHIIYYSDRISRCDFCNVNGINCYDSMCKDCSKLNDYERYNNIVNVEYMYVVGVEIFKNRIHRVFGLFGLTPEDCLNKKKKDSIYPIKSSFLYRGSFLCSKNKYKSKNIVFE